MPAAFQDVCGRSNISGGNLVCYIDQRGAGSTTEEDALHFGDVGVGSAEVSQNGDESHTGTNEWCGATVSELVSLSLWAAPCSGLQFCAAAARRYPGDFERRGFRAGQSGWAALRPPEPPIGAEEARCPGAAPKSLRPDADPRPRRRARICVRFRDR